MLDAPTKAERRMGELLKGMGVRFQSQLVLGNYIVDFYIPAAKLVIECDGAGHFTVEGRKTDDRRTRHLLRMKAVNKVIRFPNAQVLKHWGDVLTTIQAELPPKPVKTLKVAQVQKPRPPLGHPQGRKVHRLISRPVNTAQAKPIQIEYRKGSL